jgi:hypothetical protein
MISTTLNKRPAATAVTGSSDGPPDAAALHWEVLPATDRAAAMELWRQVEAAVHDDPAATHVSVTVSHLWTAAWLAVYGDQVPHEFFVLRRDAGPVGIALLTRGVGRRAGPFRLRTRHVGTAGEDPREGACVEYNDLLAVPGYKPAFQESLLTHVLRDKSWGTFCLDGFEPATLHGFLQDLRGFELQYRDSPYYDLRAARERGGDLLEPLGRSTRQNLKRLLRKYGNVDCEWAESVDHARDILAELIVLHQARWQSAGHPGAFHSQRFRAFQQTLVEAAFQQPADRRPVVLFRARHQGETVGCLMHLVSGRRLLGYLTGFADFQAKVSPGLVTNVLGIEAALQRGYDAYDFLVGDLRYKSNLSTNVNQLVWATWTRTTLQSRTIALARNLKRRWTNFRSRGVSPTAPDVAE